MTLAFSIQSQAANNWCWLAAASSVADFFATGPRTQCSLAQQLLTLPPGTQCCANAVPASCDQPGYPSTALAQVGHSQGSYTPLAPFVDIENEINNGNPVVLRLVYTGSGLSHVVVVVDAFARGAHQFLIVDDPDPRGPGRTQVMYSSSVYRGASFSWGRTYYTQP